VNKASSEAAAGRGRLARGIPFLSGCAGAKGEGGEDVNVRNWELARRSTVGGIAGSLAGVLMKVAA